MKIQFKVFQNEGKRNDTDKTTNEVQVLTEKCSH